MVFPCRTPIHGFLLSSLASLIVNVSGQQRYRVSPFHRSFRSRRDTPLERATEGRRLLHDQKTAQRRKQRPIFPAANLAAFAFVAVIPRDFLERIILVTWVLL